MRRNNISPSIKAFLIIVGLIALSLIAFAGYGTYWNNKYNGDGSLKISPVAVSSTITQASPALPTIIE